MEKLNKIRELRKAKGIPGRQTEMNTFKKQGTKVNLLRKETNNYDPGTPSFKIAESQSAHNFASLEANKRKH